MENNKNENLIYLNNQIENLNRLLGINSIINSTLEMGSLFTIIMEKIKDIMRCEGSTLLLFEEPTNDLVFKIALGKAGNKLQEKFRIKIGQGIAGWVARARESIYINDVYQDERFDPIFDKLTGYKTKSICCTPLIYKGKLVGVIQAVNALNQDGFTDDHLELFKAFSNQTAIAIENASLYNQLEEKVTERTAELADAYKKLKEFDLAKTNFFTNISHELRTPLTLILSPIESILKGEHGQALDISNPLVKSMHKNSIRLLNLINTLLDFSKIEAGKMRLNRQSSDISKMLNHYAATIKSSIETRGLRFSISDKTDGVKAWVDQDLLEKAVYNLISNAIKFTNEGGEISVTLQDDKDAGTFNISVKDTGIGIKQGQVDLIFGRFNQVESSLSRKYSGTGIGLSLAKEIVELHDGNIEISSEPGQGSTFTITVPVGDVPASIDTAEDRPNKTTQADKIENTNPYLWESIELDSEKQNKDENEKIPANDRLHTLMIVDDNPDMLEYLTILLRKHYFLITATNGKEALEKLSQEKQTPDLIVADVMMPIMDGYELIQAVRSIQRFEGLPIILVTAKAEIDKKIEGIQKGANDYLVKPFNPQELMARVKSQIELKKMRDKLIAANKKLEQVMDGASIMASDIGHKFYNELWPFTQMIMIGKELVKNIENNNPRFTSEQLAFAKDNLAQCEKSLETIEEMKEKLKRNFSKNYEKSFNRIGYVIEDLLQDFQPVLEENGIELEKKLDFDRNLEINIYSDQLKIAIENILNNAIKAFAAVKNNKQKKITFSAHFNTDSFFISIEDNGPGIPQDVSEKIFNMFFTKEKGGKKGLGLGLYLTRWIIEDCHKGTIEVESQEGKFTRFNMVLPKEGDLV